MGEEEGLGRRQTHYVQAGLCPSESSLLRLRHTSKKGYFKRDQPPPSPHTTESDYHKLER